jgi:site-specific recombinase XerD
MNRLNQLDVVKAVELGLADAAILQPADDDEISLEGGVALYKSPVERPAVTGDASQQTWKRYRAVFDKSLPFLKARHVVTWNRVRMQHLQDYATWLVGEGYAYRTEFLELTTIKQTINWMIREDHLPRENRITRALNKPSGSDTYCWTLAEVTAMLALRAEAAELHWLGDVLIALASTGMRICELANLHRSDIDLDNRLIFIKDETASR